MKTALKYGSISGALIVTSWFLGTDGNENFALAEIFGYIIMIVALSAVFMGIKNTRDEKGTITFKEGVKTGLSITLVATIIYVIGWMLYVPNFAPDFADKYGQQQVEAIGQSELTDQEKAKQIAETESWIEQYKKPHIMAAMTFVEIFPIGVIVTLISSLILKRKVD